MSEAERRVKHLCDAFMRESIATYGGELSGPAYDGSITALINPHAQDFRINEFGQLIGDVNWFATKRRILDIACGTGPYVFATAARGHDCTGIDNDVKKIELARAKADAAGLPAEWRARCIVADAEQLPFDEQTFDLVTSYTALEHMANLAAVLYEAVRVTKIGGLIECKAPDYRGPYDTHYVMAWPSFMPRATAARWCTAMNRPLGGIETFFPITLPQVESILTVLGCQVVAKVLERHTPLERMVVTEDVHVRAPFLRDDSRIEQLAHQILSQTEDGTLPSEYRSALVFSLVVRRMI